MCPTAVIKIWLEFRNKCCSLQIETHFIIGSNNKSLGISSYSSKYNPVKRLPHRTANDLTLEFL